MQRQRLITDYLLSKKVVYLVIAIYLSLLLADQVLKYSIMDLLIRGSMLTLLVGIVYYPILGLWIIVGANLILGKSFEQHIVVGKAWIYLTDILMILVFVGSLLEIYLKKKPIHWKWSALESAILFYVIVCILNAIFVGGITKISGAFADMHNVLFFVAFFLVTYVIRDVTQLKPLLWIWLIGSISLSTEAIKILYMANIYHVQGAVRYGHGTPGVFLSFAAVYSIIIMTMNGCRKKTLLFFLASFFIFASFISFYRVAWLTLFLGIIISFVFFLGDQKVKFIKILVLFTLIGFVVTSALLVSPLRTTLVNSFNERISDVSSHDKSTTSGYRLIMWHDAIERIKEHPFIGHGYGTEFTWASPNWKLRVSSAEAIHNSYLEFTLHTGLIGLFSFFLICFIFIIKMVRSIHVLKEDTPQRAYLVGILSSFVSLLVYASFGPVFQTSYSFIFIWIFMGLGVSLIRSIDQSRLIQNVA